MLYKYTNELHANEIVLLAYYIAAINIEETFHDLMAAEEYIPFEGIVLTDTFALTESTKDKDGQEISPEHALFSENNERAIRQLKTPITVIVGNPPYSVGQKSGNDNNQNVTYESLDRSLAATYVAKSKATLTRNAYDSYIRAFRWATDRLGENGVIGFVSNGAYLDSVALDGFRQCLIEDFNSIYVFNLRGNQRTSGELSRKEGGKIFGSGSRTPVAITILVKKKGVKKDGFVHYYDIGDYWTREQKLQIIKELGSIEGVDWKILRPNDNNDWINQRNPNFMHFWALGDKKKKEKYSVFLDNYASGLSTSRDAWVYSFSSDNALSHANAMIAFYNAERERCHLEFSQRMSEGVVTDDVNVRQTYLQNIRSNDETKISWSAGLSSQFVKNKVILSTEDQKVVAYRPFCKKRLAYNKDIIERPSRWDSIFPDGEHPNLVMCVSGAPLKKGFSVLMTDTIQDLHYLENSQSFPMYFYDRIEKQEGEQLTFDDLIMPDDAPTYKKRNAISDAVLKRFREVYGSRVEKEDIFYYLYALFHSPKYIELYGDNLSKEMPRIPTLDHFLDYVKVGKQLAELHIGYEAVVDPMSLGLDVQIEREDFSVEKMRFKKEGQTTKKDTIIFNNFVSIGNIPEKAYEYIVNGKSPIEWIMERYAVTVEKASGIVDDPNLYSEDPKYIFNLLVSIIHVSMKTLELIESLPEYKEI